MNLLEQNIDKIKSLCAKHRVERLFVFGSILNSRFKKSSDIDFLVDFSNIELLDYADNYFDFKESLESLLKRKVDLLENKALKNHTSAKASIALKNWFMDIEIKTWLYDVFQSIHEIESYYSKKPMIFEEYKTDTKTKRAIERNLEIIGEAVNRIRKKDANFILSNAEKIVGTRNRIIHGYDNISDDFIWSIVINH